MLVALGCTPTDSSNTTSNDTVTLDAGQDAGADAGGDAAVLDGGERDGGDAQDGSVLADAGVGPVTLANVVERSAHAICGALFRCCTDESLAEYFDDYRVDSNQTSSPLYPFQSRLPPNATLDEPGCITLMQEMLSVVWLGQWVQHANTGMVTFVPAAAEQCLDTMNNSACGAPLRQALVDDRCLGRIRYSTGPDGQRKMFSLTGGPEESCKPVADGLDSLQYGTCNPAVAFCCVPDPAINNGCKPFPLPADQGTCKPVAAGEAPCSIDPLLVCVTGYHCHTFDEVCVADPSTPLVNGDTCWQNGVEPGICVEGYCDYLGDGQCHAPKETGASCQGDFECASDKCRSRVCVENAQCVGRP